MTRVKTKGSPIEAINGYAKHTSKSERLNLSLSDYDARTYVASICVNWGSANMTFRR